MLIDFRLVDAALALHPEWSQTQINSLYELIRKSMDQNLSINERKTAADAVNQMTEFLTIDLTFRS